MTTMSEAGPPSIPHAATPPRLKVRPEDFIVEEIPAYLPSGEGEHAYLFIEKCDATTSGVARALARSLGVPDRAVGFAGLKDRHAITRQWFSVRDPEGRIDAAVVADLGTTFYRVLEATRHGNKLRRGHLSGNRFEITARGAGVAALPTALARLRDMEKGGAANAFGPQRYGSRGNNHRIGRAFALGRDADALDLMLGLTEPGDADRFDAAGRRLYEDGAPEEALRVFPSSAVPERRALSALARGGSARDALRAISPLQRSYWLSALQSAIFDDVLAERSERGGLSELTAGDLAFKHDNGAVFGVDETADPESLTSRLAALQISPSGPMWGPTMMRAAGAVDEAEVTALHTSGVTLEELERAARAWRIKSLGARRPLRVPVRDTTIEAGADEHGEFLRLRLTLPAGSFATVIAAEILDIPDEAGRRRSW